MRTPAAQVIDALEDRAYPERLGVSRVGPRASWPSETREPRHSEKPIAFKSSCRKAIAGQGPFWRTWPSISRWDAAHLGQKPRMILQELKDCPVRPPEAAWPGATCRMRFGAALRGAGPARVLVVAAPSPRISISSRPGQAGLEPAQRLLQALLGRCGRSPSLPFRPDFIEVVSVGTRGRGISNAKRKSGNLVTNMSRRVGLEGKAGVAPPVM